MIKRFLLSEDELDILIEYLKKILGEHKIVLLRGNLGSGKTTLVKMFAKKLGINNASSPTFSIQNIYDNKIYHYDLYQTSIEKFLELGLFEELEKKGIHFIEWAGEDFENLLKNFGLDYVIVEIEPKGNKREYIIKT